MTTLEAPPRAMRQRTFAERLDELTQRAREKDPTKPAMMVFGIVTALSGIGLLVQAGYGATTLTPTEFMGSLGMDVAYRVAALAALLVAYRVGPDRLRPLVPALVALVLVLLVLVYVPGFRNPLNGSNRWVKLPGVPFTIQPSELARIAMILWVADRCVRLGPGVQDMRRGVLPMLGLGLFVFGLILLETDLGGSLLFLSCYLSAMWVGGARFSHVAGSLLAIGGLGFAFLLRRTGYIKRRLAMWGGTAQNDQVDGTLNAMDSGDLFGVGFTHGEFRNARVPYLDSDYVYALIGEEFGLVGQYLVIGLLLALFWASWKLIVSLRDRYRALVAFGLLISIGWQAMLHICVVTRLAPPKGMTLPFISRGGTSLVVASLAVGLALGAARPEAPTSKS